MAAMLPVPNATAQVAIVMVRQILEETIIGNLPLILSSAKYGVLFKSPSFLRRLPCNDALRETGF